MKTPSQAPTRASSAEAAAPASPAAVEWELRLYVAGQTLKSLEALDNLRTICEAHLAGKYHIEVVDLLVTPQLARDDQIVAVPTLVRRLPAPLRKIVGDLSDTMRTLVGLQLRPAPPERPGHP